MATKPLGLPRKNADCIDNAISFTHNCERETLRIHQGIAEGKPSPQIMHQLIILYQMMQDVENEIKKITLAEDSSKVIYRAGGKILEESEK